MWQLAILAGLLIAYLSAVRATDRRGGRWNIWRSAAFTAGIALLAIAVSPPLAGFAHDDIRGHMVQHLLIGMFAPLGLVLAAPFTLLLRVLTPVNARRVARLMRCRASQLLSHPVTAMMLNVGGMYVLYMTPLYAATLSFPALHHVVHLHFLVAGYVFTWAILAGPDPAPHAPGMWTRLGVLFISMAAHATLGKLMYGYVRPHNTAHGIEEIQTAAQLMYYGGDAAELLLVVALFAMWYKTPGSRRYSFGGTRAASGATRVRSADPDG